MHNSGPVDRAMCSLASMKSAETDFSSWTCENGFIVGSTCQWAGVSECADDGISPSNLWLGYMGMLMHFTAKLL